MATRHKGKPGEGAYVLDVRRRAGLVRAEMRAAVRAAKDRPCADCGGEYPSFVMDFDHVRGEKVASIAVLTYKLAATRAGLARLVAEMAKCDVVCANCHRVRTHAGG